MSVGRDRYTYACGVGSGPNSFFSTTTVGIPGSGTVLYSLRIPGMCIRRQITGTTFILLRGTHHDSSMCTQRKASCRYELRTSVVFVVQVSLVSPCMCVVT